MQITKTSVLTGITRTLEINCTEDQFESWSRGDDLIQNIMPQLVPKDREFLMTGITEDEWESAFDDDDDEGGASYEDPF
jgi:hypothetical protein